MSVGALAFERNRARALDVAAHLRACDALFVPRLSERVGIDSYADKIASRAERFEAWDGDQLAGLVATYCNDLQGRTAFVSNVSVLPSHQGRGIASALLRACIAHVRASGFERIELEVDARNEAADQLYLRHGFVMAALRGQAKTLHLPF